MKIFIPFKVKDTGGTSIFAKKFQKGLEKLGHKVFFEFRNDYDVLFVVVQCNPLYLLHAKFKGKKIIHRLDGVYYWSVAKWKYPLLNFAPKIIHKFFADSTVYQSRYSKYCVDKFLGQRKDENYKIIYNGVDLDTFSHQGEKISDVRDNPEQKIFITVSKFRREDQILPIIESLKIYKKKYNKNFKLLVIGDFSRKLSYIPFQFKKFRQIKFLGKIKNAELPRYERSADVFLFTHLNPPCPNNILEAMGCGLPICGVADGAMEEVTIPGKNSLLIESQGDAFWQMREYNYEKFADNLDEILRNQSAYSQNSRKIAEEKFGLEEMANNYVELF